MVKKKSPWSILILVVLAIVFLFPFVYLMGGALKSNDEALTKPAQIFPSVVHWENFIEVFKLDQMDFPIQTMNSFIVTFTVTLGQILLAALAGYAFARIRFVGRDPLFMLFLATLIVPFELLFVPLYLMLAKWGWINTYLALIIPSLGNPFAIFMFRQFFAEIPNELLEVARLDGTTWWRIYWQILVPLSAPAMVTVMIMLFLFQWNALLWPLVAAHSGRFQVVQVAVASHVTAEETHWANLFGSALAASLPPMLIFLFLQRYYVQGITKSGFR